MEETKYASPVIVARWIALAWIATIAISILAIIL